MGMGVALMAGGVGAIMDGDLSARLVAWLLRHRLRVIAIAMILSIFGAVRTQRLYAGLRSELEELLPASSPAIEAVHTLRSRIPGSQHLGVVVRGPPGSPAVFVSELAPKVAAYPPELVRMVRTDVGQERRFLRDRQALFMSLDDLREARARIEQYLDRKINEDLDLDLIEEKGAVLDVSDVEARYPNTDPWQGRFTDHDRLVSPDGRVALVLVFVAATDTGIASIGPLMERVRADVDALEPAKRGLTVGYAGDVAINVEELAALRSDLGLSTTLVAIAVVAAIVGFYGWLGAIPALGVPLFVGVACGFGFASLWVEALNTSTAFLGSIVIGNGINTGIMLLARYAEERRDGVAVGDALALAVRGTWRGTLAAALAAVAAYVALLSASFRGFHQFGVIGACGIAACWFATYLLLPPVVSLLDRRDWSTRRRRLDLAARAGAFVARRSKSIAGTGAALIAVATVGASHIGVQHIEYDMSKLRRRDTEAHGEAYWSRQMDDLLGRNFTAVALMAERTEGAEKLVEALRIAIRHEPLQRAASSIIAPQDLVPTEQPAKLEALLGLRERLTPSVMSKISPDERARIERFVRPVEDGEISPSSLPLLLSQGLRERDGTFGRTVLMEQSVHGATWDGRLAMKASQALEEVARSVTPPAQLAGGFIVSSEILATLQREALPTTALAFAGVAVVTLLASRRLKSAVLVLVALLSGVALMTGAIVALDARLNFLSFLALPITFGIGVEYAVNVLARHEAEPASTGRVVSNTGSAVALCSLTTIIGYGSLLLAQNRALFSFGVLAVLGEIACVAVAVIVLPAVLHLLSRGR
jgi:predicted RND superfamily exporter protein